MLGINEIIYTLTNRPYFLVHVKSKNRLIKKFVQVSASKEKGESYFLRDYTLKMSWRKPEEPIIEGLKFLVYVDIKNAIPLKITKETKYETSKFLIKEKTVLTIKEDEERQKEEYKDGSPEAFVEIPYPPTVLHQEIDAHYIGLITASPTSTFDKLKDYYLWIIIAGIVLFWWMNKNGGKII